MYLDEATRSERTLPEIAINLGAPLEYSSRTDVVAARRGIVYAYCEEQGWHPCRLDEAQLAEIHRLPQWQRPI